MRVPPENHDQMRALTLRVARHAWHCLKDLKERGHKFDVHSTPVFKELHRGRYRTVDFTSSKEKGAFERLGAVFGAKAGYGMEILYSDLNGAEEFQSFMARWPDLASFLSVGSSIRVDFFELPVEIAVRTIHVDGWARIDDSVLNSIYDELASFWIHERLPVELLLPILGVSFEDDYLELPDGCQVVRLSDGEQLARWPAQRRRELDDAAIMATHALLVPGWEITVDKWFIWMAHPEEPDQEVHQARTFFQALAMVTEAPSGYAQILTRPKGWANRYSGALPPLRESDFIKEFSTRLARGAQEPAVVLDRQDQVLLRSCYASLVSEEAPLAIAAHRLLRSELRSELETADVLLDLCIGIESLLSDSPADMTYKLGMRAAAVLGHQGWKHPSEYVSAVKKIYERRSAIVHGRGKAGKSSRIKIADQEWLTEDLARTVLRELMLARHAKPTLDAKSIDASLIGPAIDSFFAQPE